MDRLRLFVYGALCVVFLSRCPAIAGEGQSDRPTAISVGARIFADPGLSASGDLACATCHDPANAHAQSNDLPVQLGGANRGVPGFRAVPSLRYVSLTPKFAFDDKGTPIGGFNRDGRASDLMTQAIRPLFAAHEMANESIAALVARLAAAPYAEEFRAVFGQRIFEDDDAALRALLFALSQYEKFDPDFQPFDSKYDQFLRGSVRLAPAELRGLALFNRADKGNCAACHPSGRGPNGELPLFTDFTYDNLGVPRNPRIPATQESGYFDLGLCGPIDLANQRDLCGAFKVPTLRNVATRRVFFHNGRFTTLRDALKFYVRRDTDPAAFYPLAADGTVQKFDDLPSELAANVNTAEVPYDRKPGETPRLSEAEIADLEAFLNTLTDGYRLPSNLRK
ncbi:MAG TPA: cytochrome c peroxidase [Casimicrobiaceae bacterium]